VLEPIIPSADDILEIHFELVAMFEAEDDPVSPPGPRSMDLVHSASSRPHTSIGEIEKYTDEYSKLAALFHSLTQNHPFHNGNKRTALVTLIMGLYLNRRIFGFDVSDDELYDMTVNVANGSMTGSQGRLTADEAVDAISDWLRSKTMSRNVSASTMRTQDFIQRCEDFGCTCRAYKGGTLVSSEIDSIRIGGDTREIDGSIAKIWSRKLGLTIEKTGQTFAEFQADSAAERDEIHRYISALRRLAKI